MLAPYLVKLEMTHNCHLSDLALIHPLTVQILGKCMTKLSLYIYTYYMYVILYVICYKFTTKFMHMCLPFTFHRYVMYGCTVIYYHDVLCQTFQILLITSMLICTLIHMYIAYLILPLMKHLSNATLKRTRVE